MKARFSQKWAKEKYATIIKEAINFVKGTRNCPDLLVKVFFYTEKGNCWKGNYRNVSIHGSYGCADLEMPNIITLKCSNRIFIDPSVLTEEEKGKLDLKKASFNRYYKTLSMESMKKQFVELFAHEFKHYLDMRSLMDKRKYRHWEVRADKFAKKMVEKYEKEKVVAHA